MEAEFIYLFIFISLCLENWEKLDPTGWENELGNETGRGLGRQDAG